MTLATLYAYLSLFWRGTPSSLHCYNYLCVKRSRLTSAQTFQITTGDLKALWKTGDVRNGTSYDMSESLYNSYCCLSALAICNVFDCLVHMDGTLRVRPSRLSHFCIARNFLGTIIILVSTIKSAMSALFFRVVAGMFIATDAMYLH